MTPNTDERVTMAGKHLALTERDRTVLAEVLRHGVMTRDHFIRLRLFGSKTRTNERLKRLTATGYLTARRQPQLSGGPRFVYFPGRLMKDGTTDSRRLAEASDFFLHHQLGLVDIRVAFEQATSITRWLTDKELGSFSLGFIPDGYVEFDCYGLSYCAFVEYDRGTESLGRIVRKTRTYLEFAFSGRFERTFRHRFFRTLFITDSPNRLSTMTKALGQLTDKVVRLTTLAQLVDQGPLSAIWWVPRQTNPQSLTQS
jgi:hypothetical protein